MDHARPRGRPGWLECPARATSRQDKESDPVRAACCRLNRCAASLWPPRIGSELLAHCNQSAHGWVRTASILAQ
jgi:hypothetical protein